MSAMADAPGWFKPMIDEIKKADVEKPQCVSFSSDLAEAILDDINTRDRANLHPEPLLDMLIAALEEDNKWFSLDANAFGCIIRMALAAAESRKQEFILFKLMASDLCFF